MDSVVWLDPETRDWLVEVLFQLSQQAHEALECCFGGVYSATALAGRPPKLYDPFKKDDDLFSPRHSATGEAALLAAFLGNNHQQQQQFQQQQQQQQQTGLHKLGVLPPQAVFGTPSFQLMGRSDVNRRISLLHQAHAPAPPRQQPPKAFTQLQPLQPLPPAPPQQQPAASPQPPWQYVQAPPLMPVTTGRPPLPLLPPAVVPPHFRPQHASVCETAAAGSSGECAGAGCSQPVTGSRSDAAERGELPGTAVQGCSEGLGHAAAGSTPELQTLRGSSGGDHQSRTMSMVNEISFEELTLGAQIGEGGFGKVYYGEWRGQAVAVKLLSADAAVRGTVVDEFRREISTMSLLPPHDNVLRLLGACTAPPHLALLTPYCSHGSLYALLHSPAVQLSWAQILHMCLGAARGMAHLHAHRILHRDLKSGNLLVDASYAVRVADFGLSRVVQDVSPMTGGLGTFQWMAPEVLAHQRYTEKADVYSFAIVLWECTARQVPYGSLQGMQAAMAVMNRGLRPDIPQHTPAGLAELIRACWAPIPDQRPSFLEVEARLMRMYEEIRSSR